jgi:hypothetical protein
MSESTLFLIVAVPANGSQYLGGGLEGSLFRLRDLPLHSAGLDLFFGDATGFPRGGFNHGTSAILYLTSAARGHQDIAIIAVEAFN